MSTIRFNSTILDTDKVTAVTRNPDGAVNVNVGGFEVFKFTDPAEAAAVWSYFVNRAPDGMNAPALVDPTTSAAADARDQEWQKAFSAWEGKQDLAFYLSPPPANPGELGAVMDRLTQNAMQVGRALLTEEQKAAAVNAGKPGQN